MRKEGELTCPGSSARERRGHGEDRRSPESLGGPACSRGRGTTEESRARDGTAERGWAHGGLRTVHGGASRAWRSRKWARSRGQRRAVIRCGRQRKQRLGSASPRGCSR
ncbi:uncharacterized protein M6B38_126640 [Iris pallida]|uniref:Uncharacterized protein n=1 Tax=Iris pallida TaxID=29817 RepID=A0AAX6GFF9_IRIPA|nr:uncharacterized protein M6B38_126640 [Iris pallida]